MSPSRGRKLDRNHHEIRQTLQALGCVVETIQGPPGTPDIVVKVFGIERLAEIKMPKEGLNDAQVKWWGAWGREATVLRTSEDCAALVAQMRGSLTRSEVAP